MSEAFPKPPSPGDMRTELYERESARRRQQIDAVYASLFQLDQEKAANPQLDQIGERALLEATLKELEQQQGKADAMYETGR